MAGLLKEVWIADVEELLYPENSVLFRATDHSAYVYNNIVHVPNAGANGTIVKNRVLGGVPATTYQRTDVDLTYSIDSYSVAPVIISELETYQIAYDKRKTIIYNATMNLETIITSNFLYNIAPAVSLAATNFVYTTGVAQGTDLPFTTTGTGTATGTRLSITLADIFSAKSLLDKQNVPQNGRVMAIPADMFNNELLQIANVLQAYQLGAIGLSESALATGMLARVANIDLYVRPTTVVYTKTASPDAVAAKATVDANGQPVTINATDAWAALVWHPSTVSFAKGETQVFYQEVVAAAYGSEISFAVWFGSSPLRADGKGVVAIVQA